MGYITLSSKQSLFKRAQEVQDVLTILFSKHEIASVVIEENLQAFRPGFSSAKTLLTLARFNGIVSYICFNSFGFEPEYINVNVARKAVGLKMLSKKKCALSAKQQVFNWAKMQFFDYKWPSKVLKSGPNKGNTVLISGCYDMADAYVIAKASTCIPRDL